MHSYFLQLHLLQNKQSNQRFLSSDLSTLSLQTLNCLLMNWRAQLSKSFTVIFSIYHLPVGWYLALVQTSLPFSNLQGHLSNSHKLPQLVCRNTPVVQKHSADYINFHLTFALSFTFCYTFSSLFQWRLHSRANVLLSLSLCPSHCPFCIRIRLSSPWHFMSTAQFIYFVQ